MNKESDSTYQTLNWLGEHEEEWICLILSKLVVTGGGKGAARSSNVFLCSLQQILAGLIILSLNCCILVEVEQIVPPSVFYLHNLEIKLEKQPRKKQFEKRPLHCSNLFLLDGISFKRK